jgi:hypothetical protein
MNNLILQINTQYKQKQHERWKFIHVVRRQASGHSDVCLLKLESIRG